MYINNVIELLAITVRIDLYCNVVHYKFAVFFFYYLVNVVHYKFI